MIDIHAHVLPAVDDGAQDMTTSLALLKMAAAAGTTDLICTSHVLDAGKNLSWSTIVNKTMELQDRAAAQEIHINLYPGAELEMNWDLTQLLQKGSRDYCLADSQYVLIELPSQTIPAHMSDFIYELQVREFIPVLAHPERHPKLMAEPEHLLRWLRKGALAQCNAGSFTGLFGTHVQKQAQLLLKNGVISFLGSDAHRIERRNTDLREAITAMEAVCSVDEVRNITTENPRVILDNQPFYPAVPDNLVKDENKGFFSKLFGN